MGFFNNADYRMVARSRGTDATRLHVREVVTDRAEHDSLFCFPDRINESIKIAVRSAHDMKSQPLRRLVSDARQAFQFIDEFCDGLSVFQHGKFRVSGFRVSSSFG